MTRADRSTGCPMPGRGFETSSTARVVLAGAALEGAPLEAPVGGGPDSGSARLAAVERALVSQLVSAAERMRWGGASSDCGGVSATLVRPGVWLPLDIWLTLAAQSPTASAPATSPAATSTTPRRAGE